MRAGDRVLNANVAETKTSANRWNMLTTYDRGVESVVELDCDHISSYPECRATV